MPTKSIMFAVPTLLLALGGCVSSPTYELLMQDTLVEADYWQDEPAILAAGLGFTDVNGTPGLGVDPDNGEFYTFLVGGAWNTVDTDLPEDEIPTRAYTSATSLVGLWTGFGRIELFVDGLPIEFSHPVLASTVDVEDIAITLNTGEVVVAANVSVLPNQELNEKSTIVLNGQFGNRKDPETDDDAVYPVHFEVVGELSLVGPDGLIDAQGLTYGDGTTPLTGYGAPGSGPTLCAAKLTRAEAGLAGEGGIQAPGSDPDDPTYLFQGTSMPNDLRSLYGTRAEYRLRVLTTGGFSPDGVRAVYPDEFSRYFRVAVLLDEDGEGGGEEGPDGGSYFFLEETGVKYLIPDLGGVEVVGLADLGIGRADGYDEAYEEDHDNQIDIVLRGDEAVMRRIRYVHIPAGDGYSPFYNPGGPGNNPFPGVTYAASGPETWQPVTIAIDDPMQVSWPR